MRKALYFLLFMIICTLVTENSCAQFNRRKIKKNNKQMSKFKGYKNAFTRQKQYATVGFSINALNYFGDLSPLRGAASTDISFTRPGFSLWGTYRFGPRYTAEAAYTWGTVSGSDFKSADPTGENAVFRYIRNLSFRNRIHELSALFVVDYFENNATYISRVKITPYAFIGIAVFYHNPEAKVNQASTLAEAGQWVKLKPLGTEGQNSDKYNIKSYKNLQVAIPFGIGARYRLNQALDLSFQFGIRYLFFDYIDDVSSSFVDLGELDSDLAREFSDRSRELTSAISNIPRDFNVIDAFTGNQIYIGADGNTYDVFAGYGSDTHPDNVRGNENDNDLLLFTQIRIAYILGGSFRRAKYR